MRKYSMAQLESIPGVTMPPQASLITAINKSNELLVDELRKIRENSSGDTDDQVVIELLGRIVKKLDERPSYSVEVTDRDDRGRLKTIILRPIGDEP